jgi:hypothetical protein
MDVRVVITLGLIAFAFLVFYLERREDAKRELERHAKRARQERESEQRRILQKKIPPTNDSNESFRALFGDGDPAFFPQHQLAALTRDGSMPARLAKATLRLVCDVGGIVLAIRFCPPEDTEHFPQGKYYGVLHLMVERCRAGGKLGTKEVPSVTSGCWMLQEGNSGRSPERMALETKYDCPTRFYIQAGSHNVKHVACSWKYCQVDREIGKNKSCNQCILRRCVQTLFPTARSVEECVARLVAEDSRVDAARAAKKQRALMLRQREASVERFATAGG